MYIERAAIHVSSDADADAAALRLTDGTQNTKFNY